MLSGRGILFIAASSMSALLVSGCAQSASPVVGSAASAGAGSSAGLASPAGVASPVPAAAGYACASAKIFTQPVGVPVRQTVTLGDTTATLTGTSASDGVEPSALDGGSLTITSGGHPPVTVPMGAPTGSSIVDLFTIQTQAEQASTVVEDVDTDGSLCLGRFSAGATPVALIGLTSGGVHCCTTVRAVPADGGAIVDHTFDNYQPWLRTTADGVVLVSADNAFAGQFSSFAGSGAPLQLFSWTDGAFKDVTRRHLDLVLDDAQRYRAAYDNPAGPEKLGYLAGWVADECVAGSTAAAWAFVDQQAQLGLLTDENNSASGTYEDQLRQFVTAHGYCPAS
jgi:hypothetical protein